MQSVANHLGANRHPPCLRYCECRNGNNQIARGHIGEMLKKLVNEADKKVLKQSQRNWIAFRDAERVLSSMLTGERYSGGGTIQQIIYSNRSAQATQKRVNELMDYLTRLVE